MEKNNKNIIYFSAISALVTSLIFLGGVKLTDDDVFYCKDTNIVMRCDHLSKYYGMNNGKCMNEADGNKLCKSGWFKIDYDLNLTSEDETFYMKQGYNCTKTSFGFECDSCKGFANCDGHCSNNGGELCCFVFNNGSHFCKISTTDVKPTIIPIKPLEVNS